MQQPLQNFSGLAILDKAQIVGGIRADIGLLGIREASEGRQRMLQNRAALHLFLSTYPRRPLNPLLPCPPPATAEEISVWSEQVRAEAAPLLETVGEILG